MTIALGVGLLALVGLVIVCLVGWARRRPSDPDLTLSALWGLITELSDCLRRLEQAIDRLERIGSQGRGSVRLNRKV